LYFHHPANHTNAFNLSLMRKLLLAFCALLLGPITFSQSALPLLGFDSAASAEQLLIERRFDSLIQAKNIDRLIHEMSARPHHVGSPGGQQVADYIFNQYKRWGFDVRVETFYVLFPTPKTRLLEMTGPVTFKASLQEPPVAGDATSGQTQEQLPTYNCYSPDGDITGQLVFVNYGLPEDYDLLARMGIDVKGKIVIAKYGQSWRGIKPKVAQEHGAMGCIIYSDPKDDGYYQGDVYPKGAFKSAYGVQRGSVEDMPIYPGDPLTPGVAATRDAKRLDRSQALNLLKIPVLPINYHDAEPLLRSLEGPVAPSPWRGALPITYHLGPGRSVVHIKLAFNWDIKPIHDIIATLAGSTYPDQWVIRGNHHDAWVNGACDPVSGQAALLEEARSISELRKSGWRPKRTLVYCSWDGEEPALLGSTEWVEFHAAELQQKAVLYINSDENGRGFLNAEGSHALEPFINQAAADVLDPETRISVQRRKLAKEILQATSDSAKKNLLSAKTFSIGALGSGSDFSPFIQHLGIATMDLGYGGEDEGGEYHSIYDSYDDYRRFKDPRFVYGVALAQTAGRMVLRMADAQLLPFDFTALYRTLSKYLSELRSLTNQMRENTDLQNRLIKDRVYAYAGDPTIKLLPPVLQSEVPLLNFTFLQNSLKLLDSSTSSLSAALSKGKLPMATQDQVNQLLYRAEQQLLTAEGLPRRPWYRHAVYAPGAYTGYGVKTFPGIREAIEQRNWKEAQEQIELAARVIERLSTYLDRVTALVP
jgi:N-acetylated-alpha-linked acidic dipeptidase